MGLKGCVWLCEVILRPSVVGGIVVRRNGEGGGWNKGRVEGRGGVGWRVGWVEWVELLLGLMDLQLGLGLVVLDLRLMLGWIDLGQQG